MKRIRTFGLAAAMALALMASAAVATASASVLTAEYFPATIRAEAVGSHNFGGQFGSMECSGATFESEISKPTESFETKWNTPFEPCYSFTYTTPLKQNGCNFIFRPGPLVSLGVAEGRFDIGPAGCDPMTRSNAYCTLAIGAQTGLPATYEDVVVEGKWAVKINANVTDLKYSQTAGGFCKTGTYENGTYTGTWLAKGKTGSNTWVEEETHAPRFEAEEYPAIVSGEQSSEGKHVFTMDKFTASCGKATFSGEASGSTSAITLTPKYSECLAFGFNATVAMNGCAYVAHAGSAIENGFKYAGSVDVSCPEGKKIKINAGFNECIVEIGPQSGLSGLELQNTGSPYSVLAKANISGIVYTVTTDGPVCPLSGKGTFSNSSYVGNTMVSGSLAGGRQIGVYTKGQ